MNKLEEVRKEIYRWQAKNKIMPYYKDIALDKFSKMDLCVIIAKLTDEEPTR